MIYQLNYYLFSLSLRSRENSKDLKSYLHIFYRGIQLHVRLKGTRIALLAAYYYIEGATLRLQFNVSETLDATFSFSIKKVETHLCPHAMRVYQFRHTGQVEINPQGQ